MLCDVSVGVRLCYTVGGTRALEPNVRSDGGVMLLVVMELVGVLVGEC